MSALSAERNSSDLSRLIEAVRVRRVWILITAAAFAIAAGAWQLLADKSYKASVLVSVVTEDRGRLGNVASLVSQLGPLASLAGLSGGGGHDAEPVAVLQSGYLTEKYIAENQLMPVLYSRRWDAEGRHWKVSDPKRIPTLWKANDMFSKQIRRVNQDAKSGLITLSIVWTDPRQAAEWANGLVKATNQYLRERAIDEADRNISYLSAQIAKTDLVEVRAALSALAETEIKHSMLARGSEEFALRVLDPAVPPDDPTTPGLATAVAAGALGGLCIAVFALYCTISFRRRV
jgi:uncharacterized protein involved in exopolysaccharide biosynthesis